MYVVLSWMNFYQVIEISIHTRLRLISFLCLWGCDLQVCISFTWPVTVLYRSVHRRVNTRALFFDLVQVPAVIWRASMLLKIAFKAATRDRHPSPTQWFEPIALTISRQITVYPPTGSQEDLAREKLNLMSLGSLFQQVLLPQSFNSMSPTFEPNRCCHCPS